MGARDIGGRQAGYWDTVGGISAYGCQFIFLGQLVLSVCG